MTAFAIYPTAGGSDTPASTSNVSLLDPILDLSRRNSRGRDVTVRHELGLHDLDQIEDDVTIDHYGPTTNRAIESVLVPVAGGPNSDVAIQFARNLARSWNASITLLTVLPSETTDAEHDAAAERLESYASDIEDVGVETELETGDDVVATIADLTTSHQLVVIGASERSLFQRFFRGSIPERLDRASQAPIFVVRC